MGIFVPMKTPDMDGDLRRKADRPTRNRKETTLVKGRPDALNARESARLLAALGGSEKQLRPIPRRRPRPER